MGSMGASFEYAFVHGLGGGRWSALLRIYEKPLLSVIGTDASFLRNVSTRYDSISLSNLFADFELKSFR
jgi:hypothetical protein